MKNNHSQEHADLVAQLQNQAAVALAASRRRLLEQSSHVPVASPSRQRADRILLLAALESDSGRFDHARGEHLLQCAREAASVLRQKPEPAAATGTFAHAQYAAAQLRAFDLGVAVYLAHVLTAAAVSVADADAYSLRWHALLLRAHTHLMSVALAARHEASSTDTREPTTQEFFFSEPDPVPQAKQLALMKDRYEVLAPHHESPFRFVLAPLLLIVISPDGGRRDIDLAGLIHEPDELPRSEQSPLLVDTSNTPTVFYTDRRGRTHYLVYNPAALRYERVAAHTAV